MTRKQALCCSTLSVTGSLLVAIALVGDDPSVRISWLCGALGACISIWVLEHERQKRHLNPNRKV